MQKIKKILMIIAYILILIVGILIAAFLTGRTGRNYNICEEKENIKINNTIYKCNEFAELYKPLMLIRDNTPSPPLLWIWYEVINNPKDTNTTNIVYYFNWENEINPSKAINQYYSIFRAAYFGYPLYDIEFFQLSIDNNNGNVKKIKFETAPSDDYSPKIVEHIVLGATLNENDIYHEIKSSKKDNTIIAEQDKKVAFQNKRVLAGVQTWNHLSRLICDQKSDIFNSEIDAPLRYLSNSDYKNYKFSRKSQGDFKTSETGISKLIGLLAVLFFVGFPIFLLNKLKR